MLPRPRVIEYPTSDGVPLGETDVHRNQIVDLIHGLEVYFRDRDDVYVSGNLLMLYEENDPNSHRSPDVLVVFGVPKHERDNYLIWREGKAPDFIIEVTSKSTRSEDVGVKKGLYSFLGVQEYFIFDPLREYLQPQLKGYRLQQGEYLPMIGEPIHSDVLDLDLKIVEGRLRIHNPRTGRLLPTREESEQRAQVAEHALEKERAEREALLAELNQLRQLHEK